MENSIIQMVVRVYLASPAYSATAFPRIRYKQIIDSGTGGAILASL